MTELEILARGLQALRELEEHATTRAGIPVLTPAACRPCMTFAAALLRGGDPAELLHLRCEQTQVWHLQVQAAFRLADQVMPR